MSRKVCAIFKCDCVSGPEAAALGCGEDEEAGKGVAGAAAQSHNVVVISWLEWHRVPYVQLQDGWAWGDQEALW